MSEPLYHPAEPENHSDIRPSDSRERDHLSIDAYRSLGASFATSTLESSAARLHARCHGDGVLGATVEALDRKGRPEGVFGVTDISDGLARKLFEIVQRGELDDALKELSRAEAHGECRMIYEVSAPRRTLHGEDGEILMLSSTAPANLSELANGFRRTHTTMMRGDDSLLDIELVTAEGTHAHCDILLVDAGERSRYALDDESASKLGRLAFDLIDSYIAGGHSGALARLEEAFRPPSVETNEEEERGWEPDTEREEELPLAEPFDGRTREQELPCGSRVSYRFDGSSLQFEICSGERWSDRIVYDIRIDPMQAKVERKIDYVFDRLASGFADQQIKAIKALATFGTWEAVLHNGARQHEALDDLRDHLMELGAEDAKWSNFPETSGPEIELALLNGLQHGIVTVANRNLHEMSSIAFLLDAAGEGTVAVSNAIGARLEFFLPPLDADEGLFGRKRLLQGYMERFLEAPARLIEELQEDTGRPRATNLTFPQDSAARRGYAEVGKAIEKHTASYSGYSFDAALPAVKDLGGGRFQIALGPRNREAFEMRITIDCDGPDCVILERRRPFGPMRLLGATETHSFPLRDNETDLVQIFRKYGPLANVIGSERAHASLIEYLRRTTGYNDTLPGRLRGLWRKLFG